MQLQVKWSPRVVFQLGHSIYNLPTRVLLVEGICAHDHLRRKRRKCMEGFCKNRSLTDGRWNEDSKEKKSGL